MKQEHVIFGLVGIAGIVVLYWLWKESQAQQTAPAAPAIDASGATPAVYPSTVPIDLPPLPQTPPNQSYNVPVGGYVSPGVRIGSSQSDCGCQDNDCEPAGLPVSQPTIPDHILTAGADNLKSFLAKAPLVSPVEAGYAKLTTF